MWKVVETVDADNPYERAAHFPYERAAHFREVAEQLRGIAENMRFEPRRRDQLMALADGFERFAARLAQEAEISG